MKYNGCIAAHFCIQIVGSLDNVLQFLFRNVVRRCQFVCVFIQWRFFYFWPKSIVNGVLLELKLRISTIINWSFPSFSFLFPAVLLQLNDRLSTYCKSNNKFTCIFLYMSCHWLRVCVCVSSKCPSEWQDGNCFILGWEEKLILLSNDK